MADLKRLRREPSGKSAASPATPVHLKYLWPSVAGAVAVLALVALTLFWPSPVPTPLEDAIDSIAILPFENMSNDSDWDFLSDGISEGIINSLSQMSDLKVISRASSFRYRELNLDPQTVGEELGVRALVMGRVLVRGEDLSIRAELVDVRENTQLWGGEFNGKLREILEIRTGITLEISDKLRLRLTPEEATRLTRTYTEDDQAHAAYLKGKFEQAKGTARSHKRAIQHFQQATERDPNYARAYAAQARSYYRLVLPHLAMDSQEAMQKAEEMAMKSMELDDTLAEPHAILADVKRSYHWDWEGADQEYQLALELDPGSYEVPYAYAFFMSGMGRHDEAVALGKRAQQLDPINPSTLTSASARLRFARRYEESLEQSALALELDPGSAGAYRNIGDTYEAMGRYLEAAAAWEKSLSLEAGTAREVVILSDAATSAEPYWRWWLDYFRKKGRREFVSPAAMAEVYAQLDEKDQAFAQLEKAFQQRDGGLWSLKVDPVWDPLRDDPRFTDLLVRMDLAP